jgi:hypothetical protein
MGPKERETIFTLYFSLKAAGSHKRSVIFRNFLPVTINQWTALYLFVFLSIDLNLYPHFLQSHEQLARLLLANNICYLQIILQLPNRLT